MDRDGQIKIKWPENKLLFLFLPCPCIVLISTALHFLIQQFSVPPGSQQTRPAYERPLWSCPLSAAGRAWAALLLQAPLPRPAPSQSHLGEQSTALYMQFWHPSHLQKVISGSVALCEPAYFQVIQWGNPLPAAVPVEMLHLRSAPLRAVAQERRRTCTAALKHTTVEKKECNTPFCIGHTFPQGLTQAV